MAYQMISLHTLILDSVEADKFFSGNMFDECTLKSIVNGQRCSLKALGVNMWIGSHHNFEEFLRPLSLCSQLIELKLCSDDDVNFNYNPVSIDMILDQCSRLTKLG
ncbi:hypothetical protein BD408DRAFT_431091 [Parasitella parasitica]|nr:hypothetical protein BD408DRAFT_431091 [Parasitella parasitica]